MTKPAELLRELLRTPESITFRSLIESKRINRGNPLTNIASSPAKTFSETTTKFFLVDFSLTMAPGKKTAAAASKEPRKNEKGLIENWDSTWADAVYLRTLVENGDVDGLTAGQIQAKYPQFKLFANKGLTGGLKTIRTSVQEEIDAARGPGSNGMLSSSSSPSFRSSRQVSHRFIPSFYSCRNSIQLEQSFGCRCRSPLSHCLPSSPNCERRC